MVKPTKDNPQISTQEEGRSSPAEPLRFVTLVGNLAQGGAEKQAFYLIRALYQAGHPVLVLCLTRNEYYQSRIERLGVPVEWVGGGSSPLKRMVQIVRLCRRFRPDIVYSTHFYTNLYASAAARACGAMSVGSLRNDGIHEVKRNGRWGKWLLQSCEAVFVNSRQACGKAMDLGRSAESVYYFPNCIDIAAFDSIAARERITRSEEIQFISICRLISQKRVDIFLRALAGARQINPLCVGVVVGSGQERAELEALADELGLAAVGVRFLGHCEDPEALLKQADIFVLASDYEGFPNVLLEAMAASLPILSTQVGAAADLVQEGWNGYLVAPGAVEALQTSILALSESRALREGMGTNSRIKVTRDFDSRLQLNHFLQTLVQAARQTRHRDLIRRLEIGLTLGME